MKSLLLFFLTLKVSLFLIILLAASLLPHAAQFHSVNFRYPENEQYSLKTAFKTWDAQHYLFLADKGYKSGDESAAFFPLLPILIQFGTFIFKDSFWAGILIANIFSLGMLYYFYRFVTSYFTEDVATRASFLLMVFPTAFYLSLIYTESIFLFLVMGFFFYLYRKEYYKAGLFAFFLPLARPTGILILIPFLVFFLLDKKRKMKKITLPSFQQQVTSHFPKDVFSLCLPVVGVLVYFLYMQFVTGNAFTGLTAQSSFIGGYNMFNLLSPVTFFQAFFTQDLSLHSFTTSLIDRIFFVFYLIMLPIIYKKLDKTMFMYSLGVGMVPLLGSFMAYTRYLLPVFPVFMVLALFLSRKKTSVFFLPIAFFFYTFQVLFCIMQALNYWVS